MEEVEKVIEDLLMLAEFYEDTSKCCGIDRSELFNNAIHTIRELQNQIPKWHLCKEELPTENGQYLVSTGSGSTTIYGFTLDAYKLDCYDFAEYKGQKKALFYGYDSEWGYSEAIDEVAWMELPKFESEE